MTRRMRSIVGALCTVSCLSCAMLSACGSNGTPGDDNNPAAGGQLGFGGGFGGGISTAVIPIPNAPDAAASNPTSTDTGDAICGATTVKLDKKPADLLLVLDRSSSMTRAMDSANNCAANSTTCSQRWETMTSSLATVLASSPTDVHWGLKFFTTPSTSTTRTSGSCTVSSGVEVAVAPNTASAIETQISQAGTASSTPTRTAIEAAVAYLKTLTDGNPRYILLATDGEPNCAPGASNTSNSDLAGTITAIQAAAAAGYKVYVIGVGPETGNLTDLAVAGGTNHFYPATTPAELSNALTTIVGTVSAGCSYQIGGSSTNSSAIGVYLDKSLIPQGSTDGWSLDSAKTTITINGTYCDDLKSGKKTLVEIFLPCNASDPIPTVIL